MAVTFEDAVTYSNTSPSGATETTSTVTGGTDQCYILLIGTRPEDYDVSSVSGGGLTWTNITDQTSWRANGRIHAYWAYGSPSNFTVSVTFASTQTTTSMIVARFSGVDGDTNIIADAHGYNTDGEDGGSTGTNSADDTEYIPGPTTSDTIDRTTTIDGSVVVVGTHVRGAEINQSTVDGDFTAQAEVDGTGGDGVELNLFTEALATAGSSTFSCDMFGTTDWCATAFILQPDISQSLTLDEVTDNTLFYDPTLDATASVTLDVIAADDSVEDVTLEALNDPIELNVIAADDSVEDVTLAPGTVTISPPNAGPSTSVQGVAVVPGTATLAPDDIASAASVEAPTLVPGTVTLGPGAVAATDTVHAPTLSVGASLTLNAITAADAVYAPTLDANTVIEPDSVGGATVHAPTLAPGAVSLTPDTLDVTPDIHSPTYNIQTIAVAVNDIDASTSVEAPTLVPGTATLAPGAVAPAASVEAPTLVPGTVTLGPGAVAATDTVHAPTLVPGTATLAPDAVAATDTVHAPTLVTPVVTLGPDAVAVTTDVHAPTYNIQTISVALGSPPTDTTVYDVDIDIAVQTVELTALAPSPSVYAPGLVTPTVAVGVGVLSAETAVHSLVAAPQPVSTGVVGGIPSASLVYSMTLVQGVRSFEGRITLDVLTLGEITLEVE